MSKTTHAVVLGAGLIGTETARQLAEKDIQVRAVVHTRITALLKQAQEKYPENIEIVQKDLRHLEQVEEVLDFGIHPLVFQFAAKAFGSTHTGANVGQPVKDFEDNATINENVITAVQKKRPYSLSFSSSYFTYIALVKLGKTSSMKPFKEEDLDPMSFTDEELNRLKQIQPYLWEKILAEKKYIQLSQKGIRIHRFRFGNVYGAGQRHTPNHPHMFPNLFTQREKFHMHGDGNQKRAWIYVRDIVEGLLSCTLSNRCLGNTLHNLGGTRTDSHHTLKEVVTVGKECLGLQIIQSINPEAPGGQSLLLDTQLARNELQWSPKITLDDGIAKTMDHYYQYGLGD